MSDTPQREQEIFKAALEVGAPEERRGFVRGACGQDQELLQKVEAPLAAYFASQSYLPTGYAPASPPREESGPREGPGTVLGHYKLLRKIGESGCGVVYMAEPVEPYTMECFGDVRSSVQGRSPRAPPLS